MERATGGTGGAAREPSVVVAARLFADGTAPEVAATATPRNTRWRSLFGGLGGLAGGSPREILARIVPGDPLDVRRVVAQRLRQQALLLDADRVHLRSLALCARWAIRYHGEPEFGVWIERLVDQSWTEILREEQEELGLAEDASGAFETLARPLALDPRALRLCCRSFNRLPVEDRRAFFELVLGGRPLEALVQETGRSAVEIARAARRALELFHNPALIGAGAEDET